MTANGATLMHSVPPQQGLLLGTLAAHAGLPRKPLLGTQTAEVSTPPALPNNAHVTPLFQTSVFDFDSISSGLEQVVGQGAYGYGRMGLPNAHELGAAVAALEGAEAGVATSSGMGAISAAILSTVSAGDLVIAQQDAYGGTTEFFRRDLPRYGVTVRFEDTNDLGHLEKLFFGPDSDSAPRAPTTAKTEPNLYDEGQSLQNGSEKGLRASTEVETCSCRCTCRDSQSGASTSEDSGLGGLMSGARGRARKVVIFAETVSNPLLMLSDVRALAKLAKRAGALLIVDNTFRTPLRSQPLAEGADLVIHSATKFLGGHHDLLAGAVVGSAMLVDPIRDFVKRMGLWAAPLDAWLAVRGIRTLQVRVEKAWANAATLGRQLEGDPRVTAVAWHEKVALVTFAVVGGFRGADAAVAAFRLITLSTTLGGVTTTVSHPASSSHASLSVAQRGELGISDGHLRLSVGIEESEDLWADLDRGLSAAAAVNRDRRAVI
ncbi:methionine gamma-lyase [Klebsormidium nitens]|uniref:Methionine gamma-lyase n=1 Tax=Klebsormidium nitens TaxID=105231 RepID=A0A1Y1IIJ8_KLENI|nr:methionine gamma-lyase [Klebsormidium nitens]|eukprot:GAQ88546.1 methionine gamma-lyase [Klebsormidium nitens]